ncbi:MFS transporter [Actinomyces urinae]|uniref:MFS transporter n=1 Tax=Actinomyces urinae TaxID=1689268 RepID=UPI0009319DBE|nr:MFS transporter [Actinomyces urinae]
MKQAQSNNTSTPIEKLLLIGSVVLITCLAFEALATTNALPTVVADLGGDRWYSLAAGMVLAGQILSTTIAGWWADKMGVRRPLVFGMTMFSLGALAAGVAPNLAVFIVGRAIQGLGSGMIMVPLYVMVGDVVSNERRPFFFAVFSFAWVLPSMIGPSIAGYIVQHWSWRLVFLLIIPIALAALLPLIPILRRMPAKELGEATPPPAFVAALLTSAGIIALQVAGGLSELSMWIGVIIGAALLAVGMPRLLPKGTFRAAPGVPSIVGLRMAIMAALIGAEFFLPLVLDRVHGWSPASTGWAIAIGSVAWTIGSWAQARVALWESRTKIPGLGSILILLGALLVITMPMQSVSPAVSIAGFAIMGLGQGLAHSTSSDLALGIAAKARHGDVSASLQLADALGPALAMGLSSVALSGWAHLGGGVSPYLPTSFVSISFACLAIFASTRIIGVKRVASI